MYALMGHSSLIETLPGGYADAATEISNLRGIKNAAEISRQRFRCKCFLHKFCRCSPSTTENAEVIVVAG